MGYKSIKDFFDFYRKIILIDKNGACVKGKCQYCIDAMELLFLNNLFECNRIFLNKNQLVGCKLINAIINSIKNKHISFCDNHGYQIKAIKNALGSKKQEYNCLHINLAAFISTINRIYTKTLNVNAELQINRDVDNVFIALLFYSNKMLIEGLFNIFYIFQVICELQSNYNYSENLEYLCEDFSELLYKVCFFLKNDHLQYENRTEYFQTYNDFCGKKQYANGKYYEKNIRNTPFYSIDNEDNYDNQAVLRYLKWLCEFVGAYSCYQNYHNDKIKEYILNISDYFDEIYKFFEKKYDYKILNDEKYHFNEDIKSDKLLEYIPDKIRSIQKDNKDIHLFKVK